MQSPACLADPTVQTSIRPCMLPGCSTPPFAPRIMPFVLAVDLVTKRDLTYTAIHANRRAFAELNRQQCRVSSGHLPELADSVHNRLDRLAVRIRIAATPTDAQPFDLREIQYSVDTPTSCGTVNERSS